MLPTEWLTGEGALNAVALICYCCTFLLFFFAATNWVIIQWLFSPRFSSQLTSAPCQVPFTSKLLQNLVLLQYSIFLTWFFISKFSALKSTLLSHWAGHSVEFWASTVSRLASFLLIFIFILKKFRVLPSLFPAPCQVPCASKQAPFGFLSFSFMISSLSDHSNANCKAYSVICRYRICTVFCVLTALSWLSTFYFLFFNLDCKNLVIIFPPSSQLLAKCCIPLTLSKSWHFWGIRDYLLVINCHSWRAFVHFVILLPMTMTVMTMLTIGGWEVIGAVRVAKWAGGWGGDTSPFFIIIIVVPQHPWDSPSPIEDTKTSQYHPPLWLDTQIEAGHRGRFTLIHRGWRGHTKQCKEVSFSYWQPTITIGVTLGISFALAIFLAPKIHESSSQVL